MALRPFWSFYGSAWSKTRNGLYPSPIYDTIAEPFAGGAGFSCHWPHKRVILGDLDEAVVTTWRYLLRVTPADLLALPDLPVDGDLSTVPVCEEARMLMGWWSGRARQRVASTTRSADRSGGRGRFWSPAVRQRLARQVVQIRHWRVFHCDYRDLPVSGPATWFIDPPYKGKRGAAYSCSSARIDFNALARWCRNRPGQAIVCEAAGATWLPFWHVGRVKAAVGHSSEAVCVLHDGHVDRPQLELSL